MPEKTVRISSSNYDNVLRIARATGSGIRETLDGLLVENVNQVDRTVKQLEDNDQVKQLEESIRAIEVNGKEYHCQSCGQVLDPSAELTECPSCHAELDWEPQRSIGLVGWGLAGLALLLVLNKNKRNSTSPGQKYIAPPY